MHRAALAGIAGAAAVSAAPHETRSRTGLRSTQRSDTAELPAAALPNIVFLLAESTDGRLFFDDSPVELPNIRKLQQTGVRFDTTYSAAPVCCPSRGAMFTGRHAHRIPHWHNGMLVNGLYNNFEGLNANQSDLFDLLGAAGYGSISLSDKTDWQDGGHSEDAYLEAWTHNVPFSYDISRDGGWNQEDNVCASQGDVAPGGTGGAKGSQYPFDWASLELTVDWIKSVKGKGPFVAYQGFNIVHPPYATNRYWFDKVGSANVTVPPLPALDAMHPCDLQSSMLKGCTPSDANTSAFDDPDRIRRIRQIYLAEVAEFDAMVGRYIDVIESEGLTNNTLFVVLSDHGDMQLSHRQFYKMTHYEASAHVPMLLSAPWIKPQVVTQPTQLIDIFPTLLEVAGVAPPADIDGHSLGPFLRGASTDPTRPDWVISQFHGDDIAMSWFLLRQGPLKYVVFGTGAEVPPMLYNLSADPEELVNLAASAPDVVAAMDATLRAAVDYPAVAMDVAAYQQDMFRWFVATNPGTWQAQMATGRRWSAAWAADPAANLKAVQDWLAAPVTIQPCRNATAWPPAPAAA